MCNYTDLLSVLSTARVSVFTSAEPKKALDETRRWFRRLDEDYKAYILAKRLHPYWQHVPEAIMLSLANQTDKIFLRTMLWIYEHDGQMAASDALRMWQRLKAIKQHHILTYLKQEDLLKVLNENKWITREDIIRLCFSAEDALKRFNEAWNNSKTVEYALRDALGLSMISDVHAGFKRWCKSNHPDKGGDLNIFSIVNAMYMEFKSEVII